MTTNAQPRLEVTDGSNSPRSAPRRLKDLGKLVESRIAGPLGLQTRILADDSRARATLAVLRRAVGREPGEVPEIWPMTQVDVPEWASNEPTAEEIATHTAMTLYALHQQSRITAMHYPGVGLGQAAYHLVGSAEENPSARARFNALVTSTTTTELRHHLRTFVALLRAKEIPLDYAMLADDIVQFSRTGGAARVRLRWARQYYAVQPNNAAAGNDLD